MLREKRAERSPEADRGTARGERPRGAEKGCTTSPANGRRGRAARLLAALAAGLLLAAPTARAELAVSANDAKVKLIDGKVTVQQSPPADTVTFIDLRSTPPKVLAEIEVPNSVVGPPFNVAVSPKEDIALVASSTKIDPADPSKQTPDDRVTVIDLSLIHI